MDGKDKTTGSPIVLENRAWEWALALFLHAFFFALMLEYHRWRGRNYFESLPAFLFVANKAMGIAGVMSLSCALAAGPLNRLAGLPAGIVRLRRPVGVTGALGLPPHVLVSLFLLPEKFDWPYYAKNWISAVLGIAALLGLLWLAAISWPWALRKLGTARWKAWQQTGYALILVVFLHAVVLTGKLANWPDWYRKLGQPKQTPFPPGSMVIALCVVLVAGFKAADLIAAAREKS